MHDLRAITVKNLMDDEILFTEGSDEKPIQAGAKAQVKRCLTDRIHAGAGK